DLRVGALDGFPSLALVLPSLCPFLSFFDHPAPTAIYTLSLHDALPIFREALDHVPVNLALATLLDVALAGKHGQRLIDQLVDLGDRKSTRLNSSHVKISYAVFCLKKKTLPDLRARRAALEEPPSRTPPP